jgi:hypothetical protein
VLLHRATVPAVTELTPAVLGGRVLTAILAWFDQLALGCAATALGCEVVRTALAGRRIPTRLQRIRRYLAIVLAGSMAYTGLVLTPQISRLLQAGVTLRAGPDSPELSRLLHQADLLGIATVPLVALVIGLHLFTLPRDRDEDDDSAPGPLPPGPVDTT